MSLIDVFLGFEVLKLTRGYMTKWKNRPSTNEITSVSKENI